MVHVKDKPQHPHHVKASPWGLTDLRPSFVQSKLEADNCRCRHCVSMTRSYVQRVRLPIGHNYCKCVKKGQRRYVLSGATRDKSVEKGQRRYVLSGATRYKCV